MDHEHTADAIRRRLAAGPQSPRSWWRASLETLAVGGGAAAVAYALGAWLRGLVG